MLFCVTKFLRYRDLWKKSRAHYFPISAIIELGQRYNSGISYKIRIQIFILSLYCFFLSDYLELNLYLQVIVFWYTKGRLFSCLRFPVNRRSPLIIKMALWKRKVRRDFTRFFTHGYELRFEKFLSSFYQKAIFVSVKISNHFSSGSCRTSEIIPWL